MGSQLIIGHLADIGPEREYQEDAYAFHLSPPDSAVASRRGTILVIADGEPGQQGSGPAGRLAANAICEQYYASASDYPVEALRLAMIAANSLVWEAGGGRGREGMVTRVLCAVVQGEQLILGCVGGSGAYLLRAGELAALAYDDGADSDAPGVAIGMGPQVEPEVAVMGRLAPGDRLLLCTDGLYRRVDAERIAAVLQGLEPQQACARLRELARTAGSAESLVAVVAQVPEPGEGPEAPAGGQESPSETTEGTLDQAGPAELAVSVPTAVEERATAVSGQVAETPSRAEAGLDERERELQELEAALREGAERLRQAQVGLEERERLLAARGQELDAQEAAQAERDRRLGKLEAVLRAREQELAAREAPDPSAEVGAARAETSALRQGQIELRGAVDGLRQGYEAAHSALRQVSSQATALGRDQEALAREFAGHARELGLWLARLDEYEQGLRAWQERLAEAEARAQQAALAARAPSAPPGAQLLHQWTCQVSFSAALAAGGVQQEERIQLAGGGVVACGLTVQREYIRRQYPMAVEVWASSDEGTAGRLLVGYGLDVRTLPASVVQERGLFVLTGGDEVIALPLGRLTVYAAVTGCEFATVARHKVSRDYTAFLSLAVTFRAVVEA